MGKRTAFIGKISGDAFGDLLRAHLTENAVDLRWLARGSEPSALAFVIPSADGGHDFAFYGVDTAEQRLMLADVPDSFPDELTALHFGSYSLMLGDSARAYEALMRREHGNRVISLDPNVRPSLFPDREKYRARIEGLLPFATIVKASEDDLAWLYPGERPADVAARWLNAGPALVAITLGAKGAFAMSATDVTQSAAPKVNVADTVGAGDAFMSALLAHLHDRALLLRDALTTLSADTLIDALEYANRAAAIACTRRGANPPNGLELNE